MKRNNALHEAIFQLGHLSLGPVVPEMNQVEVIVLKVIAMCEKKKEDPQKSVNVSAIVKELCIAPPAVSRSMNILEEMGYIERRVNKSDRRNTLVSLTDLGWEKHRDIERRLDAFMERIFARVGENKVQMVVDNINEIYEVTREELAVLKAERANK